MKDLLMDTENAMSVLRNCLVVTVQGELYDESLSRLRADILKKIQATKVRGMILDLCTVRVMDSFAFKFLADTARMASLLGVASVFVGLQPGVVSSLVDLEVEIDEVRTALTTEDGFEQLRSALSIHGDLQDTENSDGITIGNDAREDDAKESWTRTNGE
jgi:rsbT antagonist protein RsbS